VHSGQIHKPSTAPQEMDSAEQYNHTMMIGQYHKDLGYAHREYEDAVRSYWSVHAGILKSLNVTNPEQRWSQVSQLLEQLHSYRSTVFSLHGDIRSTLMYTLLNILNDPDDRIYPNGRIRLLAMLNKYPAGELTQAIHPYSSSSGINKSYGYEKCHVPLIPSRFTRMNELDKEDYPDTWMNNPTFKVLIWDN